LRAGFHIKQKKKEHTLSTIKPSEESKDKSELMYSNTPTSYTDRVNIAISTDGFVLMRFLSVVPDLIIENHRTILKPDVAKRLIDILCKFTGYYPRKPRRKAPKKKTQTTSK